MDTAVIIPLHDTHSNFTRFPFPIYNSQYGRTALMKAALRDLPDTVQLLLGKNAEMNSQATVSCTRYPERTAEKESKIADELAH